MKIAVLHPYPVHRGAVGGVTRVNSLVRFLAPRHDVKVFAHSTGCARTDAEAISDLAAIGVEQRLFEPERSGIARRLSWAAGRMPYYVAYNRNPELEAALAALDRRDGLDVLHVEFAYLAPLLSGLSARPVRILAEQETMSRAIARLQRVPLWRRTLYETFLVTQGAKVRRFEAAALSTFARLFAITPEEAEAMEEISGRNVGILPHVVCTRRFTVDYREVAEPTVLFVGNYTHRPNLHGLLWFVDEVWPTIETSQPEAVFEVVGPGLQGSQRRLLQSVGIRVTGRVDDLITRYQSAAVFVNPILSGGGMRGKVLESFACGLPVVSTRMGMEGIAAQTGKQYLEADDPKSFARQVTRYLRDPQLRKAHGAEARQLTESTYDAQVVFSRLEGNYRECVREHRHHAA